MANANGPPAPTDMLFEDGCKAQLHSIMASLGTEVRYDLDLAGIDVGYHLYTVRDDGERVMSPARIWLQLKGIRNQTLSANTLTDLTESRLPFRPVTSDCGARCRSPCWLGNRNSRREPHPSTGHRSGGGGRKNGRLRERGRAHRSGRALSTPCRAHRLTASHTRSRPKFRRSDYIRPSDIPGSVREIAG
jgi:hypothetical protein